MSADISTCPKCGDPVTHKGEFCASCQSEKARDYVRDRDRK